MNNLQTILLPSEDPAAYTAHLARLEAEWKPATDAERALVQSIADTGWRLLRTPRLEAGIYALGHLEFAGAFDHQDESQRSALEAKIFLTYRRELNQLSVQEGRLRRQREKDVAALREMQTARRRETKASLDQAAREYISAIHEERQHKFDPAELGLEFPFEDIEMRAIDFQPHLFTEWERKRAEIRRQQQQAA